MRLSAETADSRRRVGLSAKGRFKTRKELILETALHLFAKRGFKTTSTSLIAKEAGVSEGLIFNYYINKTNLLEEVMKTGYRRITDQSNSIMKENEPVKFILQVLDMALKLVEKEREFWQLQFRMAGDEVWQKYHVRYTKPIKQKTMEAFRKIGYNEPELESEILLLLLEELRRIYLTDADKARFIKTLYLIKSKYDSPSGTYKPNL